MLDLKTNQVIAVTIVSATTQEGIEVHDIEEVEVQDQDRLVGGALLPGAVANVGEVPRVHDEISREEIVLEVLFLLHHNPTPTMVKKARHLFILLLHLQDLTTESKNKKQQQQQQQQIKKLCVQK